MNYGPELALGRLPVKTKAEAEIVRLLSNPHSPITIGEAARLANERRPIGIYFNFTLSNR